MEDIEPVDIGMKVIGLDDLEAPQDCVADSEQFRSESEFEMLLAQLNRTRENKDALEDRLNKVLANAPTNASVKGDYIASVEMINVVESAHPWSKAQKPAYTGRRFVAVVVTTPPGAGDELLVGPHGRMSTFLDRWKHAWPTVRFHVQIGVQNSPTVQGYGVLSAFTTAIRKLLLSASGSSLTEPYGATEFDYLLLFEDDALPFAGTTWPNVADNNFDVQLDQLEAKNGSGMLLGCHSVKGFDREKT
eukprot:GEMP01060551.1.p1 GENE.GEMP01060551.1~~GEMP01060551.1.p1  ORF type:complete len:247 (+),score=57.05 GEMP01060551.1:297-1037(+)